MRTWLKARTMQIGLLSLVLGMCFLIFVVALSTATPEHARFFIGNVPHLRTVSQRAVPESFR